MIFKKIILLLTFLLMSSVTVAATICSEANDLEQQLVFYSCPQTDNDLALILNSLAANSNFVTAICSASSKACTSGVYSFVEEANGLATIAKNKKSSYCYMANEDQAQLLWYVGSYLLKVC